LNAWNNLQIDGRVSGDNESDGSDDDATNDATNDDDKNRSMVIQQTSIPNHIDKVISLESMRQSLSNGTPVEYILGEPCHSSPFLLFDILLHSL
jgi:hypothetical protein